MNNKEYFSELLSLSPSFSDEEKIKIFQYYNNTQEIKKVILILEEELENIVQTFLQHEEEKIKIGAEYLKGLENPGENIEKLKILKIQETLNKNKQQEQMEYKSEEKELNILFSNL